MFSTVARRGTAIGFISNFLLSRASTRRAASSSSASFQTVSVPKLNDDFSVKNEPVLQYKKGSGEREDLRRALKVLGETLTDVPIIVGGEEIRSGEVKYQVMPFDHQKRIASFYWASPAIIERAIDASQSARASWEATPLGDRIQIFERAADLISTKYRMQLNAATMLGQAKVVIQAEIDSAAELADFFRFNAFYAKELHRNQPISLRPNEVLNMLRHRGLEGFVAAVSPFNFTAIGGNLSSAPALLGNVVLWKPSDNSILSNYLVFKVMQEAGFPPGVINFVPSDGPVFGDTIVKSSHLTGINFTGSVPTFRRLWQQVGQNLPLYHNFPRLVGECGGKNFHFVHPSADVETTVNATILAAFEYSGQKCSACSRIYVPESLWPQVKEGLVETQMQLKLGSPLEFDSFTSAVIDEKAFDRIVGYIRHAKDSPDLDIVVGGTADKSKGYFVEPTIVQTKNPQDKIMREEIFGPVTAVYVYADTDVNKTLDYVDSTTPYALTGAVFAKDRDFLKVASERLKMSAGNFYLNDKCTGAIVGQQPFGGARLSGTNDKAGAHQYLLKWSSPQAVKQTFLPATSWRYPCMAN